MSWFRRFVETMERAAMASACAQAGEIEIARAIMTQERDESRRAGR
jgi:hypothetical protein